MHFASYEFILFLVILVVVYYTIPKKWQWMLLLAASYVFYSFAGIENFAYILTTTVTTWFAAIRIDKLKQHQNDHLDRNKSAMSREERKSYKTEIKAKQKNGWLHAWS
jgi:alginate O-acetyltransferase complex protein AlgI